jgi:hypothetical protein
MKDQAGYPPVRRVDTVTQIRASGFVGGLIIAVVAGSLVTLTGCTPSRKAYQNKVNATSPSARAALVSDRAIASNLTPSMHSVADTQSDLWWDDQAIYDIQSRELVDDWRAIWLLDSPSILNRLPIVDTASP